MYPLHREARTGFQRVRKNHVICAIWLLGLALSLPECLLFRTEAFCYNFNLFHQCELRGSEATQTVYTVL